MRTDDQLKSKRISVLEQFETNTSYFSLYLTKFLHRQIFKSFSNVIFLLLTHFFFSSVFHLTYLSTFSYYHYIARWKSSNLLYQRFRNNAPGNLLPRRLPPGKIPLMEKVCRMVVEIQS